MIIAVGVLGAVWLAAATAQTRPASAPVTTTAAAPATAPGEQPPDLHPAAAAVAAILSLAGGLIACFYGYRWQKAIFAALGFIVGATLAGTAGAAIAGTAAGVAAAVVGGVLGALLLYRFYLLAVFVVGFTLGGVLLFAFCQSMGWGTDTPATPVISIVGGIFCGVVAVRLHQMTIILATAYGGALFALIGVLQLNALRLGAAGRVPARPSTLLLVVAVAAWVALGTAGTAVQLSREARARKVLAAREDESR
ncbi:MAG: hypothetical protein ACYS5V_04235 [Planctomycetota bacterium]|jgi:hypothetical protein